MARPYRLPLFGTQKSRSLTDYHFSRLDILRLGLGLAVVFQEIQDVVYLGDGILPGIRDVVYLGDENQQDY